MSKQFYFKQFSLAKACSLILFDSLDRTQSGSITLGQNRPSSDGDEEVLRIPQSDSITKALPSDSLVSYPGHFFLGGGEIPPPSAEKQLMYSIATTDWAKVYLRGVRTYASCICSMNTICLSY